MSLSPPDSYLTLGRPGVAEIKVQRSRFIGLAAAAQDVAAARATIAAQARQYHDARHVCHAWRLGTPPETDENRNDDGEPSGTAGEPILVALRKLDLTQSVVVVVRYFGGIKLGTGGLARAYGQAASAALEAAETVTVKLGRTFALCFPYARQKSIQRLLTLHGGSIQAENYGAEVTWTIWLPHSLWQGFADQLTEVTAGTVHLTELPAE